MRDERAGNYMIRNGNIPSKIRRREQIIDLHWIRDHGVRNRMREVRTRTRKNTVDHHCASFRQRGEQ